MFIKLKFDLRPIKAPKKTTTSQVSAMLSNLMDFLIRFTIQPPK